MGTDETQGFPCWPYGPADGEIDGEQNTYAYPTALDIDEINQVCIILYIVYLCFHWIN